MTRVPCTGVQYIEAISYQVADATLVKPTHPSDSTNEGSRELKKGYKGEKVTLNPTRCFVIRLKLN